jgi:nucleotide-binding universal stress UspA family protein
VFLCYDGSPSSVYAAKMFSYIFPNLEDMKTTIVTVNNKPSNHIKEAYNFKDLLRTHFGEVEYQILHGQAETELVTFLQAHGENSIVVMGAYGRTSLSRLFHQSISNKIIQEVNVPVFITHQ